MMDEGGGRRRGGRGGKGGKVMIMITTLIA